MDEVPNILKYNNVKTLQMDEAPTFLFLTFDELFDKFSWRVFFGDLNRKIVKFQLPEPFINFKFPTILIPGKTEKYDRYVASQSGNTNHSYYKTEYVKMPEEHGFLTLHLWKIYEKLTDQRFWKNYIFIKEFIKFHKMCWDAYHKIPKIT